MVIRFIAGIVTLGTFATGFAFGTVEPAALPVETVAPTVTSSTVPFSPPTAEISEVISELEQPVPTTTVSTSSTLPKVESTTSSTTTTVPGFDRADCPEVWPLAQSVGWPDEWLPLLDEIVWAESRCDSSAISSTKDYGWTQINWRAHGERLSNKGINRDMLLDETVNLTEALWIAEYARDNYGCWSQPWYMSGDWCRRNG